MADVYIKSAKLWPQCFTSWIQQYSANFVVVVNLTPRPTIEWHDGTVEKIFLSWQKVMQAYNVT